MDFRKVTAIIRPDYLEKVERALQGLGVPGLSVTKVKGYGEYADFYTPDWMCTHVRIDVIIGQHRADQVAEASYGCGTYRHDRRRDRRHIAGGNGVSHSHPAEMQL